MANLDLTAFVNNQGDILNMGNGSAPWYPNLVQSTWFASPTTPNLNYMYMLNNASLTSGTIDMQYGQTTSPDITWASAKFYRQNVVINAQTVNPNGSITANVTVSIPFAHGRPTGNSSSGYQVNYDFHINGVSVLTWSGTTIQSVDWTIPSQTFNVIVPANSSSNASALRIHVHYPNGEFTDTIIEAGFSLSNPNPPTYVPFALRKSGTWKDLDTNSGFIKRRISGAWNDKSQENLGTQLVANTGHNRVRKTGLWLQAPQMKGGVPVNGNMP